MRALDFWKTIAMDQADLLESLVATEHQIRYCIIGGQAVNAYGEPLVSLDLDLVISADQVGNVELLCRDRFLVEHFPHSVSLPGSDLRV